MADEEEIKPSEKFNKNKIALFVTGVLVSTSLIFQPFFLLLIGQEKIPVIIYLAVYSNWTLIFLLPVLGVTLLVALDSDRFKGELEKLSIKGTYKFFKGQWTEDISDETGSGGMDNIVLHTMVVSFLFTLILINIGINISLW